MAAATRMLSIMMVWVTATTAMAVMRMRKMTYKWGIWRAHTLLSHVHRGRSCGVHAV